MDLDYTVAISGAGSIRVRDISIVDGAGTINIRGEPYGAVVYEMQPWPAFGYTLFQTLAVSRERWYVIWFYCEGNVLTDLYAEGTVGRDVELIHETSTGTCNFSETPSTAHVQMSEVHMLYPPPMPGFTFSGPELDLDSGSFLPGSVQLGGTQLDLLPVTYVDCTADCGSTPGWWELHALLYDRAASRACFGIFYMFPDRPNEVDLTYSLTLPDLSDPAGYTTFNASWSANP